jgi:hypothetical protein
VLPLQVKISLSRFEKILMALLSNPNVYPASTDRAVINIALRIEREILATNVITPEEFDYDEQKKRGRPKKID